MKNFTVEAVILSNGMNLSAKVKAESSEEAELIAGRKFLEIGLKGDNVKITSIT